MLRLFVVLFISLLMPGCSDTPRTPTHGHHENSIISSTINDQDVLRLFRDLRDTVGVAPVNNETVTVRRATRRDCLSEINDTLRPSDRANFIAAGDLSELDRNGDCWVAQLHQELLGGQIAYFDDDGRLLLTWLPPEG